MYTSDDAIGSYRHVANNPPNAHVICFTYSNDGRYGYLGTQRGVVVLRSDDPPKGYVTSGRVVAKHNRPVAEVVISFEAIDGSEAPESVTSDKQGLWVQVGFRNGRTYRATARSAGRVFRKGTGTITGPGTSITFRVLGHA
jgi:hypothetical protein